jgi:hypothetical protein
MWVAINVRLDMQGWATKLALALRPLMIYCALAINVSDEPAAFIFRVEMCMFRSRLG